MCYPCDHHCCTDSSGDHCGHDDCPNPACWTYDKYNNYQKSRAIGLKDQSEQTVIIQETRDELQKARATAIAERGQELQDEYWGGKYTSDHNIATKIERVDEMPGGATEEAVYRVLYADKMPPANQVKPSETNETTEVRGETALILPEDATYNDPILPAPSNQEGNTTKWPDQP